MVRCCEMASIVAKRLNESQKRNLVEGYRSGESTTNLAEVYGCSQNTVIRTVKTLLSSDEYKALKAARSKGDVVVRDGFVQGSELFKQEQKVASLENVTLEEQMNKLNTTNELVHTSDTEDQSAIQNLDDFESPLGDVEVNESVNADSFSEDVFQEIPPLTSELGVVKEKEVICEPLVPGVLPVVVYMLVDRSVELDARPLKEFPELGNLLNVDKERQALCLFSNQRSAKRNCGRSQRVIKVPDTNVFCLSAPFLLARGITRLVLEGSLISLDS